MTVQAPKRPAVPKVGAGGRVWRRLLNAGYGTGLYRLTLNVAAPQRLLAMPQDPWTGDPEIGNALFQGRFVFSGREAVAPNQPPWRLRPHDETWMRALHAFEWLRHFGAVGGQAAQHHARRLIRSWIDICGEWEPVAWAPDVLGRRIASWLGHAAFLLDGAEPSFNGAFYGSLARQVRHLARAAGSAAPGEERLTAACGLVWGAVCLPGERANVRHGLDLVKRELAWQVLGDGGHASRNPSRHLRTLADLVALRHALLSAEQELPAELQHAIDRMAPMLRAFRHGDGRLALFNGGFEESAEAIDAVLARADVKTRPLANAPHSGFQRLAARRTLVIVDSGPPAAGTLGATAHAGPLSFELSSGKERLIVNCGSGAGLSGDWSGAGRMTAAHSTVSVDNVNAAEILPDGGLGRHPHQVSVARDEDEAGNIWLDLAHDGYQPNLQVTHRRRLYLDVSGNDLRGEDSVTGAGVKALAGHLVAARFHLHPEVQASLVQGGQTVLLKLPSGQGWRFRAAGGEVSLHESVYLGLPGQTRRTEQIVLTGTIGEDGATLKWALRKV